MSWQPEIDEARDRRLKALEMGGAERVARQHAQGKLSARERIARLLDQGSFSELGMLATHQSQRPEMQGIYTAANGVIIGYGRIDGREVLVGALPVEGGVSAGHKSALETAEDEARKRTELENYYKQFGSPFSTAETFNFDDLVDPRQAFRTVQEARG